MAVDFYFDVHVRQAVTRGARLRGISVLTAQEDGSREKSDPELLDRAMELGRVMFTQDEDFLIEAHRRQKDGRAFYGIVYAHQLNVTIGQCVDDLELIARIYDPDDIINRVEYLPL
jgi:predicted nuclease of predicted toxin-antitoxin system